MSITGYFIKRNPDKTFTQEGKELIRELAEDIKESLRMFRRFENPFCITEKTNELKKDSNEEENREVGDVFFYLECLDKKKM